jgi:hypothetical protein
VAAQPRRRTWIGIYAWPARRWPSYISP